MKPNKLPKIKWKEIASSWEMRARGAQDMIVSLESTICRLERELNDANLNLRQLRAILSRTIDLKSKTPEGREWLASLTEMVFERLMDTPQKGFELHKVEFGPKPQIYHNGVRQ